MRGRKTNLKIKIDEESQETLKSWLRQQKIELRLAKRAKAILLLAEGESYTATSKQVGLTDRNVRKWAKRFMEEGIKGLYDKARSGRKPVFSP